jgi:hypothetical protein
MNDESGEELWQQELRQFGSAGAGRWKMSQNSSAGD